jgi:hypothetical protein
MKILQTGGANQTLTVVPRSYPSTVTLTVRDTSTNTSTVTQTVTFTKSNDKASFTHAYNLKEGRFYDLKLEEGIGANWNQVTTQWQLTTENWESVFSSLETIYLDKIFCTDQTINQTTNSYYTINSGEYTETTSYPDDEYTIID